MINSYIYLKYCNSKGEQIIPSLEYGSQLCVSAHKMGVFNLLKPHILPFAGLTISVTINPLRVNYPGKLYWNWGKSMKSIFSSGALLALLLVILLPNLGYAAAGDPVVKVIIGYDHLTTGSDETGIRRGGGKVHRRFHLVPAVAAEVPRSYIFKLRSMRGVAYVEEDAEVFALEQSVPWGVAAVQSVQTLQYNQGAGVKVAVIDTGIDLTHPDLRVAGSVTYVSGTATGNDDNGHGTHVAGTIGALNNSLGVLGVAPEADL